MDRIRDEERGLPAWLTLWGIYLIYLARLHSPSAIEKWHILRNVLNK